MGYATFGLPDQFGRYATWGLPYPVDPTRHDPRAPKDHEPGQRLEKAEESDRA